jgi:hypothetical protein
MLRRCLLSALCLALIAPGYCAAQVTNSKPSKAAVGLVFGQEPKPPAKPADRPMQPSQGPGTAYGGYPIPTATETRVGVTVSEYDDIPSVLKAIKVAYKRVSTARLKLEEFDVVFVGCADESEFEQLPPANIRKFVEEGGVLYVSDLSNSVAQKAFPEYMLELEEEGKCGVFDCAVVDPQLKSLLGERVSLNFEDAFWAYPTQVSPKVRSLITCKVDHRVVPILITFNFGKGTVLFTSFHNHAETTAPEKQLVKALVTASVKAGRKPPGTPAVANPPAAKPDAPATTLAKADTGISLAAPDASQALADDDPIAALKQADPAMQKLMLRKLTSVKGYDGTLLLSRASEVVCEELRSMARELLAKRLAGLTPDNLIRMFELTDNTGLRVALIKATEKKRDRKLTQLLIEQLRSRDERVANAAHETLCVRTEQRFGVFSGAAQSEREATIAQWESWWSAQPADGKRPAKAATSP